MMNVEPTHDDVVYAAGLFDGEGTVGINRRSGRRRTPEHCLRVSIYQMRTEVLFWIQDRWGGGVDLTARGQRAPERAKVPRSPVPKEELELRDWYWNAIKEANHER